MYTDGGCDLYKRIGGWGVVVVQDGVSAIDEFSDVVSDPGVTNNICELLAFEKALSLAPEYNAATIISDSQYVVIGYNKWMHNWVKNDWLKNKYGVDNRGEAPIYIKNLNIWHRIYDKYSSDITAKWVKGHDGNEFNELADILASKYRDEIEKLK